jgi:hypothetical protein
MARVVLGTYAFRYPLGGMLSWQLQWAVGLQRLGHEVLLAEKSGYANACFDPVQMTSSDDCSYAINAVPRLLARHDLDRRWCYVDQPGTYFGLNRDAVETFFRSADLFIDLGTHGAWLEEAAAGSCVTLLVDGEPGYTQIRRELNAARGRFVPAYDYYYSNGAALPTPVYVGPTAGVSWRAVFNPVVVDLFPHASPPPPPGAPFTTVMRWQAHAALDYRGTTWRQKDVEFAKFIDLPRRTEVRLDLAVSGDLPREALHAAGWTTRSARETTLTYDAYHDYIARSAGEFSVCKEAYVALRTGWFSDRSAAYLAAGRPVVMQETGFSRHLPCGAGLFAVNTVDEAADAIEVIRADYVRHSTAARDVARAHLDASIVLLRLLREIGL